MAKFDPFHHDKVMTHIFLPGRFQTGKTPLHLAARGSFIGIVDMLIKSDRHHQATEEEVGSTVQCGEHHHCFYGATCNVFSGRANTVSKKVKVVFI